jgi:outer membrane immunogenic protein
MKSMIAAASAAALAAFAAPALAQDATPVSGPYVNLGYAHADTSGANFETFGARLGYRFGSYLGVEGEGAWNLSGDTIAITPTTNAHVKLSHEYAAYGVGFLPLNPNTDLFARVGYGTTKIKASAAGVSAADDGESFNFGVGGQYHFDGSNGLRLDYTRQEFTHGNGHSNVFGIAFTHRF